MTEADTFQNSKMYRTWIIIISLIYLCNGSGLSDKLINRILRKLNIPGRIRSSTNGDHWNNFALRQNPPTDNNFCPIPIIHDKAPSPSELSDPADEHDFPWIARVFHSKTEFNPFLCTAAALKEKIFITAGACLATAKVAYTTVHYQNTRLHSKAFVLREEALRSQQMFDDIGLVVVDDSGIKTWLTINTINKSNRTGNDYEWFETWGLGKEPISYAVGYVVESPFTPNEQKLYKLDKMLASNELCHKIVQPKYVTDQKQYKVPCYHRYSVENDAEVDPKTRRYLRGLGHVLYIIVDDEPRLVGVATWSCGTAENYLPVGIAVPNSEHYFKNLNCAESISKSTLLKGYQELCDLSV